MDKINLIAETDNSTVVAKYVPSEIKSTNYQSEAQLEAELIKILQGQGYEYSQIKNDTDLINNLRIQIEKLNNYKFSDTEWQDFYKEVLAKSSDGIKGKTKKIQEERKFELTQDNGHKKNIIIIDTNNIHNNSVQVINQFAIDSGNYKNRYDVSILVNGLPLVHIELKRRGVDLQEAFNQMKRYQRDSFWAGTGLFEWVQIFVISNGTFTKYFSNTAGDETLKTTNKSDTFEFTMYWADANNHNIYDLVDFAKTFFAKHTILNILTKYCVFTSEKRLLVMRPYQIVACERIINRIICGHQYKKYGSVSAGGYIWHTTGSGKTLTSFKTAQLISKLKFDDKDKTELAKVLFVVDRKDLDYQTMKEYDRFQPDCANSNTSTKVLTEQLESNDPEKKIIITTIQKLSNFIKQNPTHDIYNKEIVMVFDECHRSQFGSMHRDITKKFKKYYMFGFTGTPIFAENADNQYQTTEQLFGDKLHTYTIVDAINDKNVLKFKVSYYNTIKIKDDIKDKKVPAIDTIKAFESKERISMIVEYIIEHYSQYTRTDESYIFNALQNVKEVSKDHKTEEIRKQQNLRGFNSLLACSSINMAKMYYEEFKKHAHNLKVAIIYSFGVNEEAGGTEEENNESTANLSKPDRDFLENATKDYNSMFNCNYDTQSQFQNYYKDISHRMKNKEIDILIVVNMFLTGFDATTLNTLWVDKNLKYHGLIQAFSRTNRILNSVKTFGNIVCFRSLEEELNAALSLFGNQDSKGIILLRPYEDYINGYKDGKEEFVGYNTLVEELKTKYALSRSPETYTEADKIDFIRLYGQILRVRNILTSFDDFDENTLLSDRELQDYQSRYLNLYHEFRGKNEVEKENINDDLVFEIELAKQVEVNIDYIMNLIKKYAESKGKDKKILIDIQKGIDSSFELRNKKDLILAFINTLNIDKSSESIYTDFQTFMNSKRKEELDALIKDENLKEEETYNFIKNAFKHGQVDPNGVEITHLFKPGTRESRFNRDTAEKSYKQKHTLLDKINDFFERFFNISGREF